MARQRKSTFIKIERNKSKQTITNATTKPTSNVSLDSSSVTLSDDMTAAVGLTVGGAVGGSEGANVGRRDTVGVNDGPSEGASVEGITLG
jgi:hypothetical protein